MRELEAGDDFRALIERELKMRLDLPVVDSAKPTETPAALPKRQCPDCTTSNDADAQFCKKCGKQLF